MSDHVQKFIDDLTKVGGFAFPSQTLVPGGGEYKCAGMTMRQWFAGMALQGMHARDGYDDGQATPEQRAKLAFIDADAMIKEDNKNV